MAMLTCGGMQGAYTFQFYKHGCWHPVVVDNYLPCMDEEDRLAFACSGNIGELWPSLMEKAYAKLHGSYFSLEGCTVHEALEDLTGGVAFKVHLGERPAEHEGHDAHGAHDPSSRSMPGAASSNGEGGHSHALARLLQPDAVATCVGLMCDLASGSPSWGPLGHEKLLFPQPCCLHAVSPEALWGDVCQWLSSGCIVACQRKHKGMDPAHETAGASGLATNHVYSIIDARQV